MTKLNDRKGMFLFVEKEAKSPTNSESNEKTR